MYKACKKIKHTRRHRSKRSSSKKRYRGGWTWPSFTGLSKSSTTASTTESTTEPNPVQSDASTTSSWNLFGKSKEDQEQTKFPQKVEGNETTSNSIQNNGGKLRINTKKRYRRN